MFKAIHRIVLGKDNILPGEEFGNEDFNLSGKDTQRLIELGAIIELHKPDEVIEEAPKELDEPNEEPDEVIEEAPKELDEPNEEPDEVTEEAPVKNLSGKLKVNTGKRRK